MPRLMLPITDGAISVQRPMIEGVIHDLFELTNLSRKTKIYFPGEVGKMKQTDSSIGHEGEKNSFGVDGYVFIDVDVQPIEDQILTNSADKPGANFVFMDDTLEVYSRPTRTFTSVQINIRYRSRNRPDGERWLADMRNRVAQGREALIHNPIDYSYDVPYEAMQIFKEIHRLRENKYGYGQDFKQWFEERSSKFTTIITNQGGQEKADIYTVRETMSRIQGRFDFPVNPSRGQYSENLSAWEFSFTYTFQADMVDGFILIYPIIVHNQLLSNKFVDFGNVWDNTNYIPGWDLKLHHAHHFEAQSRINVVNQYSPINIPAHDDFIGKNYDRVLNIFNALIQLHDDPKEDVNELLDLTKIGKLKLAPEIVEFLIKERRWVTMPYRSAFFLAYYRKTDLITHQDKPIRLDEDGIVRSNEPFDHRERHHVSLCVVSDMDMLSDRALDALCDNACVLRRYIKSIWPSYDVSKIVSKRGLCGPVSRRVIEDIREERRRPRPGQSIFWKTVGVMWIDGFFDIDGHPFPHTNA